MPSIRSNGVVELYEALAAVNLLAFFGDPFSCLTSILLMNCLNTGFERLRLESLSGLEEASSMSVVFLIRMLCFSVCRYYGWVLESTSCLDL